MLACAHPDPPCQHPRGCPVVPTTGDARLPRHNTDSLRIPGYTSQFDAIYAGFNVHADIYRGCVVRASLSAAWPPCTCMHVRMHARTHACAQAQPRLAHTPRHIHLHGGQMRRRAHTASRADRRGRRQPMIGDAGAATGALSCLGAACQHDLGAPGCCSDTHLWQTPQLAQPNAVSRTPNTHAWHAGTAAFATAGRSGSPNWHTAGRPAPTSTSSRSRWPWCRTARPPTAAACTSSQRAANQQPGGPFSPCAFQICLASTSALHLASTRARPTRALSTCGEGACANLTIKGYVYN